MVTLNEFARKRLERQDAAALMLGRLQKARDLLPMYKERFHAGVSDPGDGLRHCELSDIAFYYVEPPSAFRDAWSGLRQLGKDGGYSNEDVDKQIATMLSELEQIETEVRRIQSSRDDGPSGSASQ